MDAINTSESLLGDCQLLDGTRQVMADHQYIKYLVFYVILITMIIIVETEISMRNTFKNKLKNWLNNKNQQ